MSLDSEGDSRNVRNENKTKGREDRPTFSPVGYEHDGVGSPISIGSETYRMKHHQDKGKDKVGTSPISEVAVSTEGGDGEVVLTLKLHKPVVKFNREESLFLFKVFAA